MRYRSGSVASSSTRGLLVACSIAVALVLVACTADEVTVLIGQHPDFDAAACTSCKEPLHDYLHEPPYDSPGCERCHSLRSWTSVSVDHANDAFDVSFHGGVDCIRCHTEERPLPAPECAECHAGQAPHGGASACESCHNPATAWGAITRPPDDHLSLEGGHEEVTCFECHDVEFADEPRGCVDCHGKNHGGITDCERCHEPANGWQADEFDHDIFFGIVGAHTRLDCADCHRSGRFAGTPRSCSGCHGSAHGGLTNCGGCHVTTGFRPSTFNHATRFVLSGRHLTLGCGDCHANGVFTGTPVDCVGCHGVQHGGLSDCAACHTVAGFKPSTFDHSTAFVLKGIHARLDCSKCHPQQRYANVIGDPATCLGCHVSPHGSGYATCPNCHTYEAFVPTKPISHPAPVVLGTAHASRTCTLCHPTLRFSDPVPACQTCHTTPHVGPTQCINCHRPTVWNEVHFTHTTLPWHARTDFMDRCLYCHPGRDFSTYSCTQCHFPGGVPWDGM